MDRIEYKSGIDKSVWTFRGPWDSEPDKIQWQDEKTKLPCLIVRNYSGALCGYVGVPNTHPLHGKDFDDVQDLKVHGGLTFSRGCADMSRARWAKWREGLFARRDEAKRFPHGETARYFKEWASALEDYDAWLAQGYASYICHVPGEGEPDDVWWFGFDCAHASDFCPGYQSSIELDQPTSWGTVVEYRDVAYVTEQCRLLAEQLSEYQFRRREQADRQNPCVAPMNRLQKLESVERAARRLIKEGLRLTPDGLIVREANDKTDPHYELCCALDAIEPLNPK